MSLAYPGAGPPDSATALAHGWHSRVQEPFTFGVDTRVHHMFKGN